MKLTRSDLAPGHLRALIRDLDAFGLTHALPQTRVQLARAEGLRHIDAGAQRAEYDDLPRRLAHGELSLSDAVERAEALAPWVATGDDYSTAHRIAENAAALIERQAVATARTERDDALRAVVGAADKAVAVAVAAGREITGNQSAQSLYQEYATNYIGKRELPSLFTLDVTTLPRQQFAAWARADEASQRVAKLRELARGLIQLDKPAMRAPKIGTMRRPGMAGEVSMIQRCAEPLHLALMAASGYEPSLIVHDAPHVQQEPPLEQGGFSLIRQWGKALVGGKR